MAFLTIEKKLFDERILHHAACVIVLVNAQVSIFIILLPNEACTSLNTASFVHVKTCIPVRITKYDGSLLQN